MKKSCKICQNTFDFCPQCTIKGAAYKAKGFCSQSCYDISNILQRYGCKLATPEEIIEMLKPYNIDNIQLQPKIEDYYKNIKSKIPKPKAKPKVEVAPIKSVEVVIENEDTTASDEE